MEGILRNRGIESLWVTGVTTEVCVNTTVREANDRGFECLVLEDCVGSYFPEFQRAALDMIKPATDPAENEEQDDDAAGGTV